MRAFAVVILVAGFILGGWTMAAAEAGAPAERPAKVTADRLNLRGSPSTTGDVVGSMVRDDAVTILEEQGEWYRLRLESGQTGWAASKYIQVIEGAPTRTSETPAPQRSEGGAKEALTPRTETSSGGGGGSFFGTALKWTCLVGAGACGYLAYNEHTKGNDSYDSYKKEYNRLVLTGQAPAQALDGAEHLRLDAEDHDKTAKTYGFAAGALGVAWVLQEFIIGGGGKDQAASESPALPDAPLLACGLQQGQLRAAVTLARF